MERVDPMRDPGWEDILMQATAQGADATPRLHDCVKVVW